MVGGIDVQRIAVQAELFFEVASERFLTRYTMVPHMLRALPFKQNIFELA